MKFKLINFLLLATALFVGCKKEDARYPFDIDLQRVPYLNVTIDATGSQAIDVLNLGAFQGKYSVSLLYPEDVKPSKVDVVVIKNGVKSSVKVLQSGVTTFPSSFTVTGTQLQTLFGTPVALGDNYDIGVDIYTADGAKYEAFPATTGVTAYGGTGQANQPGFLPTARFSAICAYDPAIYQGNFVVVSDAFGDFSPGEVVVLTRVSNTSFSFTNPYAIAPASGPVPIVVNVNTGNNTLTIAKTVIGSRFTWSTAYTNPAVAVTGSSSSVAPCDKTVTMNIAYTVDQGSFGSYALVLRKQ